MHRVRLADLETRMGPADRSLPLSDALGAANVALNHYELAPGDSFAYGFHAHENQEEVFYVQEGTVTFRTLDGDVEVSAGELVRFGPGEFQRGVNESEERVRALAIGAPQDPGDTEILRACEECGEETPHDLELADDQSAVLAVCAECGTTTGTFD
ncbi:cupin domain-containing protein [Halobacterium zhouii]|uniref:cupin domain-containing protein n=1 Tax=Halobacterium zhouii TaxID=2902624 RepID=UPI001E3A49F9|nr:cupin domain-containing protein [Halobacterium zhouii]